MDKPAADYFQADPVTLAGYMPRKRVQVARFAHRPIEPVYDMAAIVAMKPFKTASRGPIQTYQSHTKPAQSILRKGASLGKLLARNKHADDAFMARLGRLS